MNRTEKLRAQLSEALEQIPEAFALLGEFILPGSAPVSPDGPRGASSPSRPPLNLVVLELTDRREKPDSGQLRTEDYALDRVAHQWRDGRGKMTGSGSARRQGVAPTLISWVRVVDDELDGEDGYRGPWKREGCCHWCPITYALPGVGYGPCVGPLRPHAWIQLTVSEASEFLLGHVDWIVDQQWATEITDECTAILRDIQSATGERSEPVRLTCPKCGWALQGQGEYDKERRRHPWYRCAGCSAAITTASEVDKASKEAEDFVTLKYAAEQIERPYATLRWWKQQGWISPLGSDKRGDVFSLAAIRQLSTKLAADRTTAV